MKLIVLCVHGTTSAIGTVRGWLPVGARLRSDACDEDAGARIVASTLHAKPQDVRWVGDVCTPSGEIVRVLVADGLEDARNVQWRAFFDVLDTPRTLTTVAWALHMRWLAARIARRGLRYAPPPYVHVSVYRRPPQPLTGLAAILGMRTQELNSHEIDVDVAPDGVKIERVKANWPEDWYMGYALLPLPPLHSVKVPRRRSC